jgi:biopolymer transport protein ExbB
MQNRNKVINALILTAIAFVLSTQLIHAEPGKETTFADIFWKGKETFTALIIASILMVTFIIDGFIKLRVPKLAPPAFIAKAKELVRLGAYQELWEYCRTNPCFVATILQAGLERLGRGRDAVESMISEVGMKEATKLKENMSYLSVIGVITPMIGLTGTVVGMIAAFKALGTDGDPTGLSAAISKVLYATAGGLIVAVPAFVFYYYFRNRAQSCILEAQNMINRILDEIPFEELSGVRIGETQSSSGNYNPPTDVAAEQQSTSAGDNPWGAPA